MNLSQLEYLVELVNKGSYKAVASAMYVTPQAVSKSVGQLEKELGTSLAIRSGRGIEVTKAATEIAHSAESILQIIDDIKGIAQSANNRYPHLGSIRLGVADANLRGNILDSMGLDLLERERPQINLSVVPRPTESCIAALSGDALDAALILQQPSGTAFSTKKLHSIAPMLIVNSTSKYAQMGRVTLASLDGATIALPFDLQSCHAKLVQVLDSRSLKYSFVSLPPFPDDHREFLRSGGVIFAYRNSLLTSLVEGTVSLELDFSSELSLPIYLAFDRSKCASLGGLLLHYLRKGRLMPS